MNEAFDHIAAGQVDEAVEAATAALRQQPSNVAARVLLLDLCCINGQWDKAVRHIDALARLGSVSAASLASYRVMIKAEQTRASFAAEGRPAPVWMGEPPAWAADHFAGLERLGAGEPDAARVLLQRADASRTPRDGRLGEDENAFTFQGLRDLDDTLGPCLEVVTQDGLVHAPWDHVQFLDVAPPRILRDLIWAPAKLALVEGTLGTVYLPALYPGTSNEPDGPVRLGRETRWRDLGAGLSAGVGLKMFLLGDESRALFELRALSFAPEPVA